VKVFDRHPKPENERGQTLVIFALVLPVLVLFAALAVDVGFAYMTKAKLSKAVDAACLTGMRNLSQGQSTARTLAVNTFTANYAMTTLDANAPVVNVTFSTNANGNETTSVDATATIKTFFMQYLPQYKTFNVSDHAQALRGTLVMSIVLDRSGSMSCNNGGDCGGPALINAVPNFVANFQNTDYLAMMSFASDARVDDAMASNNITNITNTVNSWNSSTFAGGTFGLGGINLAKAAEDGENPPGTNIVKIVVYFTDGKVNTISDTFNCVSKGVTTPTLYNYGGYDNGSQVDFFVPKAVSGYASGYDLGGVDGNGYPPAMPPSKNDCSPVTQFYSQSTSSNEPFQRSYVTADAKYRSLQTANAMLNEGITIYSIGLSTAADQTFLQEIANDPSSPTYNPKLPEGLAVFVPNCPSSTCTADLNQVFQVIASKILLRLSQ
jgi:Flp pilus assembly protein TadG